jgi:hypothetical protein
MMAAKLPLAPIRPIVYTLRRIGYSTIHAEVSMFKPAPLALVAALRELTELELAAIVRTGVLPRVIVRRCAEEN